MLHINADLVTSEEGLKSLRDKTGKELQRTGAPRKEKTARKRRLTKPLYGGGAGERIGGHQ